MQKHVHLVDLAESFPTNILLQNLASIQKITSPIKFAHLAEESDNGSVSNLSTKVLAGLAARREHRRFGRRVGVLAHHRELRRRRLGKEQRHLLL